MNTKFAGWPDICSTAWEGRQAIVTGFDGLSDFSARRDDIIVMTDGWEQGPAAAVLRGGINARTVLDVMAAAGITKLKIFHLEEKIPQLESIFMSSVVSPAHEMFDNVSINWRREPSVYDLIKDISADYNMLFFGAPLAHSEVAPFYQSIKEVYPGKVAIVRGPMHDIDFDEADEIYRWVRGRTFDAEDFSLPTVLRGGKRKRNLKITVALPSLNEEKTVGKVIEAALEVKAAGVIDEVVLIDSASTDNTVAIAKSFGIPVHLHPEIAPELGSYQGKGEAMFKTALVTDADIIAWVDTDIENITARFFYGLLGPLLT